MSVLSFEPDPDEEGLATAFIEPHGDTAAESSHIVDRDLSTGSFILSLSPPRQNLTPEEASDYIADLRRVLRIVRATPMPCSYSWCQSDHSAFEGLDWHRQSVAVGSIRIDLALSPDGPQMTWGLDGSVDYLATLGDVQSFRGLAADLSAAVDVFEEFTRSLAASDDTH